MNYLPETINHAKSIHDVLQTTIRTVYPKYYPQAVVDFFCDLHSLEHVQEGIASGNMGVVIDDEGNVIGTGCYDDNHITGVYVRPAFQGFGCGTLIIDKLEEAIAADHDVARLDASLPAACLYEHRGYKTVGHGVIELDDGVKLVYEKMERQLR